MTSYRANITLITSLASKATYLEFCFMSSFDWSSVIFLLSLLYMYLFTNSSFHFSQVSPRYWIITALYKPHLSAPWEHHTFELIAIRLFSIHPSQANTKTTFCYSNTFCKSRWIVKSLKTHDFSIQRKPHNGDKITRQKLHLKLYRDHSQDQSY